MAKLISGYISEPVFVDSSILFSRDKKEVVNPSFKEFFDEYSIQFNLKLMIPEVVKGELKYQHISHIFKKLDEANNSLDNISSVTGKNYKHNITEERIKNDMEKKFNSWIKGNKAVIVATPIKNIQWDSLIKKSIWREPPFAET